jgi:hypothetical protein
MERGFWPVSGDCSDVNGSESVPSKCIIIIITRNAYSNQIFETEYYDDE